MTRYRRCLLDLPRSQPSADRSVEHVFLDNARYVYAIAMRILGNRADVEDLLQDVFIAAAMGLRDTQHPAATRRWLVVVTQRIARHRLRRRRLLSPDGDASRAYEEAACPAVDPERRALLSSIYRTVDELPEPVRRAWSLRYVEGMQLEDVAAECGCSLATAKRRIATAASVVEAAVATRMSVEDASR